MPRAPTAASRSPIRETATIWQFAKTKGKSDRQRRLIGYMIGPRPNPDSKKAATVPWLGDWTKRRKSTVGYLEDSRRIESIRHAIKERLATFEAAQAFAPVVEVQVKEGLWLLEELKSAFEGRVFLPDESPDSADNQHRVKCYLSMFKEINAILGKAQERWLQVHGLNPSDAENWMKMLMMSAGIGGALGASLETQMQPGRQRESNDIPAPFVPWALVP